MNFHKHHDLIIAWAKGAKIEYYDSAYKVWEQADNPGWDINVQYRLMALPIPKTTLRPAELATVANDVGVNMQRVNIANAALAHFINSGDCRKYLEHVERLGFKLP